MTILSIALYPLIYLYCISGTTYNYKVETRLDICEKISTRL